MREVILILIHTKTHAPADLGMHNRCLMGRIGSGLGPRQSESTFSVQEDLITSLIMDRRGYEKMNCYPTNKESDPPPCLVALHT